MEYDHHLYSGRPAEARTETEERCYDFLDGLGYPMPGWTTSMPTR